MQKLSIIDLPVATGARIVVCGVPGIIIEANGALGLCETTLNNEMARFARLNIATLVGLIEDTELEHIAYCDIAASARSFGIQSVRFPIRDFSIPTPEQEADWEPIARHASQLFVRGRSLAIHCMAGIGRSCMMAGKLLISLNTPSTQAVTAIRSIQPDALETDVQVDYLLSHQPGNDITSAD